MKNMVKKLSVLLNNTGLDRGMKNRLYNILEVDSNNESKLDELYSYFMILMIVIKIPWAKIQIFNYWLCKLHNYIYNIKEVSL